MNAAKKNQILNLITEDIKSLKTIQSTHFQVRNLGPKLNFEEFLQVLQIAIAKKEVSFLYFNPQHELNPLEASGLDTPYFIGYYFNFQGQLVSHYEEIVPRSSLYGQGHSPYEPLDSFSVWTDYLKYQMLKLNGKFDLAAWQIYGEALERFLYYNGLSYDKYNLGLFMFFLKSKFCRNFFENYPNSASFSRFSISEEFGKYMMHNRDFDFSQYFQQPRRDTKKYLLV